MIILRFSSLLFIVSFFHVFVAAQGCDCCNLEAKGQKKYDAGDWLGAATTWKNAQKMPDANQCPNLSILIKKAQDKISVANRQVRQNVRTEPNKEPGPQAETNRIADDSYWDALKDGDTADCEKYLRKYPNGVHAAEARERLLVLTPKKIASTVPSTEVTTLTPNGIGKGTTESKGTGGMPSNMIFISGGTFQMGSNDAEADNNEKPVHSVSVGSFYLSKYEVTVKEYLQFVNETNGDAPVWKKKNYKYDEMVGLGENYNKLGNALTSEHNPIVGITWNDAVAYCVWLSKKTGKSYRLPTEAEWEYAAGGGDFAKSTRTKWAGTSIEVQLQKFSNSAGTNGLDSYKYTAPVGSFQPNNLGLYDMSGNVWEWCTDNFEEYSSGQKKKSTGLIKGLRHIVRGGSWEEKAVHCRVADRSKFPPTSCSTTIGFRVAASN